jgi:hypothetical protein
MKYILAYKYTILKHSFIASKPLLVMLSATFLQDINNVLISVGYCLALGYSIVKLIKENKK